MGRREFNPLTSNGFVWRDRVQAEQTLNQFRADGSDQLHVVWDWDGTVVPQPGSSWHSMRDALPDTAPAGGISLRDRHIALYRHYSNLQAQGRLTSALEREWSAKALTLHVVNRTTLVGIQRAAAPIRLRRGAQAAFRACESAEVPTVVLSAGVKDVIELVAKAHGIRPTTTVATELITKRDVVVGWDPDTLVDSSTKKEMGHPDLSMLRTLRPNAVAFGDQPHDADMFEGPGLRVRVDGIHTIGSVAWEAYLRESWAAGYDCVSVRDNLLAVSGLMGWLIGGPQQSNTQPPTGGVPPIPGQPVYDGSRFNSQRPV